MPTPVTSRAVRKCDAEDVAAHSNDNTESTPAQRHATLPTPQRSSKKQKKKDDFPIYQEGTPEPALAVEEPATTSKRPSRKTRTQVQLTPIMEDESDQAPSDNLDASSAVPTGSRPKSRSPFDNWPRLKAGVKRDGERLEGSSTGAVGKRTRSTTSLA